MSSVTLVAPAIARAQVAGTVGPVTIEGSTGVPISFSIYLPPGYDASGNERYPVVYHLHGLGGAHNGNQINIIPRSHENAVALGLVTPVIIVFPDGYRDSFWADSFDGATPAESDVMDAIIPHVDAKFRTIADRGHRIMQGFSMGGFGAAKFAAKYPETFGASVLYDGALLRWSDLASRHATVARDIFNDSDSYFEQFSPYFWVDENATILQSSVPYRQVVGNIQDWNDDFYDHLLASGITPSFIDTPADHALLTILNSADPPGSSSTVGQVSWNFIQAVFDANAATTVRFNGIAEEDGWIEELAETAEIGGTINAQASSLRVGDTPARRQLRSVLSFDTSSIPDGATIVSARLTLTRVSSSGSTATLRRLSGDVQRGSFGGNRELTTTDFEASATAVAGVPSIPVPAAGQSITAELSPAGLLAVNRGVGRTQIRLAFALDDDDDGTADQVAFGSASNSLQAARPVLEVTFR